MLSKLPTPIKGFLSIILLSINTFVCSLALYALAILKLIVPEKRLKLSISLRLAQIANLWSRNNNILLDLMQNTQWEFYIPAGLSQQDSYLIVSNHQAWTDIVVLQRALGNRVPFLRFFIKKQLMWVPLLGPAWWALDFPFMQRHSKEYLQRHPEKRKQDLLTIQKSCERFKDLPTSILIFVEGTRFTREKHEKLQSPYKKLLPPKTRGTSTVLEIMGNQFKEILDVTIIYPRGVGTFWDLLCGRIEHVKVTLKRRPIPESLLSWNDSNRNQNYQITKEMLQEMWKEKDDTLLSIN